MSTTPRTDAAWSFAFTASEFSAASAARQMRDKCAELETELAAAKERIADCEYVMDYRYKIIERQEQRCNEANARAEKAEADTARMDWLEKEALEDWGIRSIDRAAIDKAMKEASK